MDILQAIRCRSGKHEWNTWKYKIRFKYGRADVNVCESERICNYCQKRETRQEHHSWQEWAYVSDNRCEQKRVCSRCQGEESQSIHDWENDWKYKSDHSCELELECRRCHHKMGSARIIHDWGEWKVQIPYDGEDVRICNRCRIEETRPLGGIQPNGIP